MRLDPNCFFFLGFPSNELELFCLESWKETTNRKRQNEKVCHDLSRLEKNKKRSDNSAALKPFWAKFFWHKFVQKRMSLNLFFLGEGKLGQGLALKTLIFQAISAITQDIGMKI